MTKTFLCVAALLYLSLIALALRPGFDLEAARIFYGPPGHFVGATPAGSVVRYIAWAMPFAVYLVLLLAWAGRRLGVVRGQAPTGRAILFLTLSLALGPGLLVHGILKEVSHRPRPYNVADFGGEDVFRPFYKFDGACPGNCAFASGETAAATWMLAPASLVPPPWRAPALAGAFVVAAGTGLFRMAFGAHFLSDVSAAMLIMVLLVLALNRAIITPHRKAQRTGASAEAAPRDR